MRYLLTKTLVKPFLPKLKIASDEWFFVMHIPKTAGTTFRFTLYNHTRETEIYPNYQTLTHELGGKYPAGQILLEKGIPNLFPDPYKILIGHYQFDFQRYFSQPPRVITFLRNPVERTKSHLLHIQTLNPKYRNHTLEEIFEITRRRMLNFQSRVCGFQLQKDNFSEALDNLRQIEFVGISEQFNESIRLMNRQFNWQLKPVKAKNRSNNSKNPFSASLESKISEICTLDILLYEEAKDIFAKKVKSL